MNKFNHTAGAFRICVDKTDFGNIEGRVYSQRLTEDIVFTSVSSLLLLIESVLDKQQFPKAFQRTRTFLPQKQKKVPTAESISGGMDAETVNSQNGKICTFLLYVITRQNTTWQGYIDWLDGSTDEYSSVLELLKLTDSRISGKE